jgi:cytohesin
MGILLQSDDHVEENSVGKRSPLAEYAAEHWVTHAQFERVLSFLRKPMEYLFNLDIPKFSAWLELRNIDTSLKTPFDLYRVSWESGVTPLYYAALCGFQDFVEHLVVQYPQHVNTGDDKYRPPLVAALAGRHFQIARHLLHSGAHVDVRSNDGRTPLSLAARYGDLEMVQLLLEYKADANARGSDNWAPLHLVTQGSQYFGILQHGPQMLAVVARTLLEHGADVSARLDYSSTPLHKAALYGTVEVMRVLLVHGANVGAKDKEGRTPLHVTAGMYFGEEHRRVEVVRVLLEHGANVGVEDNRGRIPFQIASAKGHKEIIELLSEKDAKDVS